MSIKLLRQWQGHKAGEILNPPPSVVLHLCNIKFAEVIVEPKPEPVVEVERAVASEPETAVAAPQKYGQKRGKKKGLTDGDKPDNEADAETGAHIH